MNTNLISNTMKRFQKMTTGVLYALLCVVIFCGCHSDQEVKDYNTGKVMNLKQVLVTLEIDSCEYLAGHVPSGDFGWIMTHKGNCKFCATRSEK